MSMLGSIVNVVTDPGALVKDAVNSLLPKNLAIVGDIAAAVVDFQTGRPLQAAQHAFSALRDLPQALNGTGTANTRGGSPAFEPAPPPPRTTTAPGWRGTAVALPHVNTTAAAPNAQQQTSGLAGFTSMLDRALKLLQGALGGNLAPPAAQTETPKSNGTQASTSTSTKASTESTSADDTKKSTETKSSSTKSTSSSSTKSSSSSKSDSTTMAKLDKMSDGDFMAAVRNGKIPDDVLNDPKAMMQIQARMNQISEMTKLMTSMMQALHDMQMSIIQNVRV